ncbi:DUF928 domain-containing protein [Cyanobacteria bacterium FACHB-471]|nr:DUF928 domain-containing protein [Cyanobacteria bacterium FACHB-471]
MKRRFRSILVGALVLAIANSFLSTPPALAQSAVSPGLIRRVLNLFNPPRNRNSGTASGRQFAGASRDLCPPTSTPLTALVPDTNLGLTLDAHPTLWFYIPYASPQDYETEFVLIDAEENDVYKQNFSLPAEPGIISIQIPEQVALEAGDSYRWVISVMCNSGNRSGDATVNGWIQRVDRELDGQLASTTLEGELLLYSENALWYEMLTTLAQLRRDQPDDPEIEAAWKEFLTTSGLSESVASAPVTLCCAAID